MNKKVGFIGHNTPIGIWDGSETWTLQTGINIEFSGGNAIQGIGASVTLKSGTYKAKVIAKFKVVGVLDQITLGHGLGTTDIESGRMLPVIYGTLEAFDGYYTLEYEKEFKTDQIELYNIFLYKTVDESANISCTSLSIMFHEI